MGVKRFLLETAVSRLRDSRLHHREMVHAEPEAFDKVLDILMDLMQTMTLVQELTKEVILEKAEVMFGESLGTHGARALGRTAFELVNQFVF
jgi:hypothetical protein